MKTETEIIDALEHCSKLEWHGDDPCPEDCPLCGEEEKCEIDMMAADLIEILLAENRALRTELTVNSTKPNDQAYKADAGKPRPTLVPVEAIWAIAKVREYGCAKYGDNDNWRLVEPQRYRDAMMRHALAYIACTTDRDYESGLPHLWHLMTNGAFLCALENY